MLKITATGNLTNNVELKMNETTGRPYAILRIASDRRYRAQDGSRLTDFISIKVRGPLAEWCAAYAVKGCKLTAHGDFETITFGAPIETQRSGFDGERSRSEMSEPCCGLCGGARDMELAATKDPIRRPGFLIKATDVDFLSPKRAEDCAQVADSATGSSTYGSTSEAA